MPLLIHQELHLMNATRDKTSPKEARLLARQRDAQRCDFVRKCESLDRFNRRVAATKPPSSKTIWKRFDTNPDNPAPPTHNNFALTRLASLRQTAADLSRGLSRQIKLRLWVTFVLMFFAACCRC